jgi:hypothetical protein
VPGNAVMRIPAGEHGAAKRAAEREPRDMAEETGPVDFRAGEVRSPRVWVAIRLQRLRTKLIAQNPENVRTFGEGGVRNMMSRGRRRRELLREGHGHQRGRCCKEGSAGHGFT